MTPGDPGWRSGAGTALAVAAGDPASWALALLGFLVRGGWLIVVLPLLSIPSPVLLSMLFRGEVGDIGRGELRVVAVAVGTVLSVIAIGGVVLSAFSDVALAERFVHDPESEVLRHGRAPRSLSRKERRSLAWWVASVQAVALLPIIVCVAFVVDSAVRSASAELINPSTTQLPLVGRVAPAIAGPVAALVLVVIVAEALSSLASRRLMVNAWEVLPGGRRARRESLVALGALGRVVRTPLRVAGTALAGWLLLGLVLAGVLLGSVLAWSAVRDVLVSGANGGDPVALAVAAFLVATFVAVWLGGLGLVGFVCAVRSGLWTADALR